MPTLVRQATLLDVLVRRGSAGQPLRLKRRHRVSGPERQLHASLVADGRLTDGGGSGAGRAVWSTPPLASRVPGGLQSFPSIPVDVMRQFACVPIERRRSIPGRWRTTDCRGSQLERAVGRSCRIHVAPPRSAIAESLRESTRNSQVVAKIKDEFRPLLVVKR